MKRTKKDSEEEGGGGRRTTFRMKLYEEGCCVGWTVEERVDEGDGAQRC